MDGHSFALNLTCLLIYQGPLLLCQGQSHDPSLSPQPQAAQLVWELVSRKKFAVPLK
jgi:hypothetical protein